MKKLDENLDSVFQLAEQESDEPYGDAYVVELLLPYVKARPEHGMAWLLLGDSLRVIGRFDESLSALQKALDFAPEEHKSSVYARLGMLYEKHKSPREAEEWYKLAAEQNNHCEGWVLVFRGANLVALGEYEAALDCYNIALQAENVDQDEVLLNIGITYVAKGDYPKALSYMQQALEKNPDYSEAKARVESLRILDEFMKKN